MGKADQHHLRQAIKAPMEAHWALVYPGYEGRGGLCSGVFSPNPRPQCRHEKNIRQTHIEGQPAECLNGQGHQKQGQPENCHSPEVPEAL